MNTHLFLKNPLSTKVNKNNRRSRQWMVGHWIDLSKVDNRVPSQIFKASDARWHCSSWISYKLQCFMRSRQSCLFFPFISYLHHRFFFNIYYFSFPYQCLCEVRVLCKWKAILGCRKERNNVLHSIRKLPTRKPFSRNRDVSNTAWDGSSVGS